MLQLKRWAKHYLTLSPIYHHPIFTLPHHEHIMQVNPRLLGAYCLNMLKRQHYNPNKITQIMQVYNKNSKCYWSQYVYSIIDIQSYLNNHKPQTNSNSKQDETDRQIVQQKIGRLRHLIAKTFHQQISKQQFKQLTQVYLTMLDQYLITQMDNFVIGLSLHQLTHISTFAEMKQGAQFAIGPHSIQLLQSLANKCQPAHYFSVISILNRIKSKLNNHLRLRLLGELVQLQTNYKQLLQKNMQSRVFVMQQWIGFMLWLLHMHQLGSMVYQHIRKNYLLVQYQQQSIMLVGRLLHVIQIDHTIDKHHLVMLNEIVYRIYQLQQQTDVFVQLDQNMQLTKTLQKLKNKVSQLIQIQLKKPPIQLLQQLNQLQIDFYSTPSRKLIQLCLNKIIADPFSPILLTPTQIYSLFELSIKIDSTQMHSKLSAKFKNQNTKHYSNKLIDCVTGAAIYKQGYSIGELSIDSICQLMRVKHYLSTKTVSKLSHLKLTQQQINYLHNLQLFLTQPNNNSHQLVLQRIFNQFQL